MFDGSRQIDRTLVLSKRGTDASSEATDERLIVVLADTNAVTGLEIIS